MFFRELKIGNPTLDDDTPALWSLPFSYCVVHVRHMLLTVVEIYRPIVDARGLRNLSTQFQNSLLLEQENGPFGRLNPRTKNTVQKRHREHARRH